jgi:DNA-binding CsgD family transcriptional regulator
VLETRESRTRVVLVGVGILAFALMLGVEVLTDDEPVRALDLLGDALQMALLVVTSVATALLATRMHSQHEEKLSLIRDLETAKAEGEAWRREAHTHVAGLGMAIEQQFEEWELTSAEREIGLLMLKGFAHKEIAALRGTTNATVRHQAKGIYQKAGVENRAAFCAFFLEDLLPGNQTEAPPSLARLTLPPKIDEPSGAPPRPSRS